MLLANISKYHFYHFKLENEVLRKQCILTKYILRQKASECSTVTIHTIQETQFETQEFWNSQTSSRQSFTQNSIVFPHLIY